MLKSFKKYFGDMSGIAMILFVGIAVYASVNLFFDKVGPTYANVSVTVHTGDTLWSIAGEFGTKNEDIRDVIDRICETNNLKTKHIYPGQTLTIPVVKE